MIGPKRQTVFEIVVFILTARFFSASTHARICAFYEGPPCDSKSRLTFYTQCDLNVFGPLLKRRPKILTIRSHMKSTLGLAEEKKDPSCPPFLIAIPQVQTVRRAISLPQQKSTVWVSYRFSRPPQLEFVPFEYSWKLWDSLLDSLCPSESGSMRPLECGLSSPFHSFFF